MQRTSVVLFVLAAAIGRPAPLLGMTELPPAASLRTSERIDSIVGTITDGAGTPIPAIVSVTELGRTVQADATGRFAIGNLPSGHYTLHVRAAGFSPQVINVTLAGSHTVDIALERSAMVLEPIVVTATRSPSRTLLTPISTRILGPDEVRANNTVSIAHTIEGLSGVRTLSTGSQIGKPVIRGLSGQRVLVLDDGDRIEDYSWSDEDGPSIDAAFAERVEVVRGPASVLYGSDALGGVVNVIPPDLPSFGASTRARVGMYVASNNAETGALTHFEGSGAIGWRLSGAFRRAASLHTPAGELDNTGFTALNGEGAIGKNGDAGGWSLRVAHYGGEFKLLEAGGPPPGGDIGEEAGPERKAQDDRVQLNGERVFPNWRLEAKGQFQRHSLIEVSDEAPGSTPGTEGTAFDLLLNTFSADVMGHFGNDRIKATVGVNGVHQSNDSRGPIGLVPDATLNSGAGYVLTEVPFERVSFLAGARFDVRGLTVSGATTTYNSFAGDAGAVVQVGGGVAIVGNIGRGWRAPNLFELYADGPRIGEARYEIGRSDLVPERSTNLETGLRLERPHVRAEVTGYRNDIAHYIFIAPTNDQIDGLRVYRYQQADARLLGVDGSLDIDIASTIGLHARGDGVHADNRTTGNPLPLTPPVRLISGVDYYHASEAGPDRFTLGGEVENVARQSRLNPLDMVTAGYTLVNLHADVTHAFGGRTYEFNLAVRNVANVAYTDFLSRYKEFALNPGRDITFRVTTEF